MRKTLVGSAVAVAVVGLVAAPAEAQLPLTFVAGPSFITISSDGYDTKSTTGFFAAVGTSFPLSETVSLSPFVGYVQKGAKFESDDTEGSYDYIEVPVLLEVAIPVGGNKSLGLSAGPAIGFQIKCDEDGFDCTEFENHKGTEVSFVGAAGLGFPLSETSFLGVGGGFDRGLTDLFEDVDYKTRGFFLFLSFTTLVGG
jgi:hypothetical protein